jgi:D-beta-D-heptose 7-phosphate kinase/D-beta-D-heptose 1-phosphate adenosyltransferase
VTDSALQPNNIDACLEARLLDVENELDKLRDQMRYVRLETRSNSQRLAYLEPIAQDLKRIALSAEELGKFLSLSQEVVEDINPPLPQSLTPSVPQKYVPNPNDLVTHIAAERKAGRKIVFTNGCFDILHAGHVSYLNRAKALGDILIIGVNSDNSIRRLKGATRPINPLEDRIQVLSGLGCVDHLVAFDEDTPSNLLRIVRPDIYVKGGDYTKKTLPEAPLVEQLGGVVELLPFIENRSTSKIIERICQLKNGQ